MRLISRLAAGGVAAGAVVAGTLVAMLIPSGCDAAYALASLLNWGFSLPSG